MVNFQIRASRETERTSVSYFFLVMLTVLEISLNKGSNSGNRALLAAKVML